MEQRLFDQGLILGDLLERKDHLFSRGWSDLEGPKMIKDCTDVYNDVQGLLEGHIDLKSQGSTPDIGSNAPGGSNAVRDSTQLTMQLLGQGIQLGACSVGHDIHRRSSGRDV